MGRAAGTQRCVEGEPAAQSQGRVPVTGADEVPGSGGQGRGALVGDVGRPHGGHSGAAAGPDRGGIAGELSPPAQASGARPRDHGGRGGSPGRQETCRKGHCHKRTGFDGPPCAGVAATEVSELVLEDRRKVPGVPGVEPVGAEPQVPAPAVAGRAGVLEAVPVTGQGERDPLQTVPGGEGAHVVLGLPHARGHRQVERRGLLGRLDRADEGVPGQCLGEGAGRGSAVAGAVTVPGPERSVDERGVDGDGMGTVDRRGEGLAREHGRYHERGTPLLQFLPHPHRHSPRLVKSWS